MARLTPGPAPRAAMTPGQRAAADALLAGLRDPGAVAVLAGEAGLGKSTLLRYVLDQGIGDLGRVVTVHGAAAPSAWEELCRGATPPGPGLLVIEDAHQMSDEQLLQMAKLLDNSPRESRPRLVFVGRPQFWVALSSPNVAPLQRAIGTRAVLCRTGYPSHAAQLFATAGPSRDARLWGSGEPHAIGRTPAQDQIAPGGPRELPPSRARVQRLVTWLLAAVTLALAAFAAADRSEMPAGGSAVHAQAALADAGPVTPAQVDGGSQPTPDGPTEALLRRGDEMLALEDMAAARSLYERAARAGSRTAATLLGNTYDPALVNGDRADARSAAFWYGVAATLGGRDAPASLARAKVLPSR